MSEIYNKPLFYRGEPIVHEYSLSPLEHRIDIERLKSSIGKNDTIGFSVCTDNPIEMFCDDLPVNMHILSGLIYKCSGYHRILFPHIMHTGHHSVVLNGDIVEYITAVDHRHHYGEVRNIEGNKVWIKEYAGHCFDCNGCKLHVQDSYIDTMVCIPLDACTVLHKDDYHIEDMRHASTIRALWTSPCLEACNELRSWFSAKGDETIAPKELARACLSMKSKRL